MLLSQPLERLGATEAGRYGTPSQLQALGLQRGPFAVRVEAAQQCNMPLMTPAGRLALFFAYPFF
jgi:hypothetical protein